MATLQVEGEDFKCRFKDEARATLFVEEDDSIVFSHVNCDKLESFGAIEIGEKSIFINDENCEELYKLLKNHFQEAE